MEARDTEAALAKARQGDGDAFRVLVEAHARRAFSLAFRLTGSAQDAEDVVQESFIRAYRRLPSFESRANFGTWLHRIVVNCAIDSIRARHPQATDADGDVAEAIEIMPSDTPSPERLARSAEVRRHLAASMEKLTALERLAFVLRHDEGRSIDEIGRTLGIRESAAKHAVFRAVRKLRASLGPLRRHA
jgi:RNA polymerase sigma-70 factor (ECF subfamily)